MDECENCGVDVTARRVNCGVDEGVSRGLDV